MRLIHTCFFSLLISTSATADWCDGSKWLFTKMPMDERVAHATSALDQLGYDLLVEEGRLNDKVSVNSRSLREQLIQQHITLKNQTTTLCQSPKKSSFPLAYQQVELKSVADFKHQLGLNLNLLSSQQQMISALEEEEKGFLQYSKQLSRCIV